MTAAGYLCPLKSEILTVTGPDQPCWPPSPGQSDPPISRRFKKLGKGWPTAFCRPLFVPAGDPHRAAFSSLLFSSLPRPLHLLPFWNPRVFSSFCFFLPSPLFSSSRPIVSFYEVVRRRPRMRSFDVSLCISSNLPASLVSKSFQFFPLFSPWIFPPRISILFSQGEESFFLRNRGENFGRRSFHEQVKSNYDKGEIKEIKKLRLRIYPLVLIYSTFVIESVKKKSKYFFF